MPGDNSAWLQLKQAASVYVFSAEQDGNMPTPVTKIGVDPRSVYTSSNSFCKTAGSMRVPGRMVSSYMQLVSSDPPSERNQERARAPPQTKRSECIPRT